MFVVKGRLAILGMLPTILGLLFLTGDAQAQHACQRQGGVGQIQGPRGGSNALQQTNPFQSQQLYALMQMNASRQQLLAMQQQQQQQLTLLQQQQLILLLQQLTALQQQQKQLSPQQQQQLILLLQQLAALQLQQQPQQQQIRALR